MWVDGGEARGGGGAETGAGGNRARSPLKSTISCISCPTTLNQILSLLKQNEEQIQKAAAWRAHEEVEEEK